MEKDVVVAKEFAQKFVTEKNTYYKTWVRAEGLDIIDAHYVPNLHTVALKPWARRGGRGVFLNHQASDSSNDCYVCEIPAGGELKPQRQLFEEMIYVLDGRGSTSIWNDAGKKISFEWKAGALFAIPLNTLHQHFNGSGKEPARFVAVTNAPMVMNIYLNAEFVFQTKRDFPERFDGEQDYFVKEGKADGFRLDTNFIADAMNLSLTVAKERGGGGHIRFNLARGSMPSHISQFPVATYKKAHAHKPGAHVIILSGEGYSMMWPDGGTPKRYDWQEGSMIVPYDGWYHQHFNMGTVPARYLAFKYGGISVRNEQGVPLAWISTRLGGKQLDFADESPILRETFAAELGKRGLKPNMEAAYQAELADLPPLPKASV
jgi:mannose-6-phosphate isomerase-like protein (cupin superfamily)